MKPLKNKTKKRTIDSSNDVLVDGDFVSAKKFGGKKEGYVFKNVSCYHYKYNNYYLIFVSILK